ncbi:MAG: hypothetical protein F6J98_02095 [Moorea sp. SIO4G2]|nr:hypothetical protein [Moorena sp. SIO4G2]
MVSKAEIATVYVGLVSFEGLMTEEGDYAIAVTQIAEMFEEIGAIKENKKDTKSSGIRLSKLKASRDVKALLAGRFELCKLKSPLNNRPVNTISLIAFEYLYLVRKLDKNGNTKAEHFVDDLLGLSLHQLFSDAFKVKFEAEDRQAWLVNRQKGKVARREYTDSIRDYLLRHPEKSDAYRHFVYSTVSDIINLALTSKKAKELRIERGVRTNDLLRDTHDEATLRNIERVEDHATQLVDVQDMCPIDAARAAIAFYRLAA